MQDEVKTITLDNVILQENGILRDENGLLIARLVDSVKFDDIENRLKIAENKVRIKEVQQFYLALTMAEELKPYSKIFHNIAKKRLEELEFWNLNRKKGE